MNVANKSLNVWLKYKDKHDRIREDCKALFAKL